MYSFIRAQGPFRSLIACNFSSEDALFVVPDEIRIDLAVLVVSNYPMLEDKMARRTMYRPYEARIYTLR